MNIKSILTKLIAFSSVSGDESRLANFIVEFVHSSTAYKAERIGQNVVVRIKGRDSRRCLIFNGHIDTVEAGNLDLWHTNPYALTEKDGFFYGLGVSDMKGSIAVFLALMHEIASGGVPNCDVIFMFVVNEETTGEGTREVLAALADGITHYDQKGAIIAEPTDGLVTIGHRGNIFAEMVFGGSGGHASNPPELGRQAIILATELIREVPRKIEQWRSFGSGQAALGDTTMAVTGIRAGGKSTNQVPTSCSVKFDIRTNELLYEKIPGLLNQWATDRNAALTILTKNSYGYCDPNDQLVKAAVLLAQHKDTHIYLGSTDQCFFTEYKIPAIIWGPGEYASIHAPNERVATGLLDQSAAYYKKMLSLF